MAKFKINFKKIAQGVVPNLINAGGVAGGVAIVKGANNAFGDKVNPWVMGLGTIVLGAIVPEFMPGKNGRPSVVGAVGMGMQAKAADLLFNQIGFTDTVNTTSGSDSTSGIGSSYEERPYIEDTEAAEDFYSGVNGFGDNNGDVIQGFGDNAGDVLS
jgi:hypothetical protein